MAKKGGTHVSRAGRKQARERQRRAAERGLPQSEVASVHGHPREGERVVATRSVSAGAPAPDKRGVSVPVKVGGLLVLLLLAIWLVAQYRQAAVGTHDVKLPAKPATQ